MDSKEPKERGLVKRLRPPLMEELQSLQGREVLAQGRGKLREE